MDERQEGQRVAVPGRPRREALTREMRETLRAPAEDGAAEEGEPGTRPETLALLRDAVRGGATDIHLDPVGEEVQVRMRVDGVVLDGDRLPVDAGVRLVNQVKTLARLDPTAALAPEQGRASLELDGRELDLRVTVAPCLQGEKLSLRLLEPKRVHHRLQDLGLGDGDRETLASWLERLEGMLLVAGPMGSGKTTTLYAMLHELRLLECNLITIEDPAEYQIAGINQIQVDAARGLTFARAIRAMLRLDADYLLLGEIRDAESARAAVDAATSGKGLMSTLHSRDAAGVVSVMRNYGLDDHEIAANLAVVVSQRLVRTLCRECRVEEAPTEEESRWLKRGHIKPPKRVWHAVGCERCQGLGFAGRTGVFEVWRVDDDDHGLLLEHADERTLRQQLARKGHGFMLDDALEKVRAGVTSLGEVRRLIGYGSRGDRRRPG